MYLLLRNNKQSGPYSLDELKSMGLKAYDLVWLEGKSAAWRYPCEIDALKDFAPPVDEQPFDRFYKRPSASAAAVSAVASSTTPGVNPAVESPIPVTVESTRTPGKRIIYVTMPAGKAPASPAPFREPVREPIQPMREPAREPVHQPVSPAPVVDYSTQLSGVDETVELLPRRMPRQSSRITRYLAIGISILALLAAGIFIGLSLNKETLPFSSRVVAKIPPANTDQPIVHTTAQSLPVPASVTPAVTNDQAKPVDSSAATVKQTEAPAPSITQPASVVKTTAKTGRSTKDKLSRSMNPGNAVPRKDSAAGGSIVREAVHRADVESRQDNVALPDKEAVKMTLISQVSVGANGYSVGTFGGINDLQLTVTNRSAYPLDLVIVEVQYIQANKKVYKTENLYFRSIGAGAALMQEAPRSSRGVKVLYKITNISSKELGLSYSGI